jgi:hypothetical protein
VHPGQAASKPQAGASAGSRAPGAGPDVAGAVRFEAMADFVARIWLAGETVAIDLRPLAAGRVDAGADPGPEAGTVYGKLGQWIALADSGAALQGPGAAPSAGPRTGLWIRVDVARPGAGSP